MAELQALQTQSQQEQDPLDSFQLDFGLGVSQLSAAQQAQLKAWVGQKSSAGYRYRLRGYADAVGDPEKNLLLSKMRTDAVRNVLLQMGVPMEKIEAEFYGANLQSLAKRRVEVQVFLR
ncbi:MAG: OmpA family protein [Microscillaceae bacterium]|nr:OmpA family protein [Microscillaceae bacterium]